MDAYAIRDVIAAVTAGRLTRRAFVHTLVALGVAAPLATDVLRSAGLAATRPAAPAFTPSRRGGGGRLRLLWWQAPVMLNPHFANGVKDVDASRPVHEPLVSVDPDGNLVPVLAAEIPSVENSRLAKDGTWVVWPLRKGVVWHDGTPFTAADVVFNWEYAADPATAAVSLGTYRDVERIERVDDHAVKVVFKAPTPFWYRTALVDHIPKHGHGAWKGQRAREAPHNLKPVGTGPYRVVDFRPGDAVRYEINPHYHVASRPFFDHVELKGGGDAVSAARAVLQTGEFDFAWNVQVEDDVLRRLEQSGKGRVDIVPSGSIEHVSVNQTDPSREVDGERSSVKAPHPVLTDPKVAAALTRLVDRAAVQTEIYGRQGQATGNFLNMPARYRSTATRWEFDVDRASQLLDEAGWARGRDGVRVKDGRRLRLVLQTSQNAPRQKTQAIIKQAAAKAGIELELKSITPSVFFSSDPGNADTVSRFSADLQLYTVQMGAPDPQGFMEQFTSWEVAAKANNWSRRNVTRLRDAEYDRLWKAAEHEMNPAVRAAHFIRMNDRVVQRGVVIPILWRNLVQAVGAKLRGVEISGWDSNLSRLAYWYRDR
ncbi:MAG: peptide ABC transporter substrate-binding protein [Candidatus Rokubacteria bacterium]|nr:peptide ABC transporter substrate-binding protein [Candidatus Rokubacteria bacterium]